jgi:hypothetical protein
MSARIPHKDKHKMAIPNLHAPDEEWAEERVKRMMEPDEPVIPLTPGDEVFANKLSDSPDSVDATTDSTSDVDLNSLSTPPISDETKKQLDDNLSDLKTDNAVDEVVKADGDAILLAQDNVSEQNIVMKPNLWERLKNDLADWWGNPRKRYITLGIIAILIAAVFSFSSSRLFALNLVGFRGNMTISVLDGSTNLPLKNANVTLAGKTGSTDSNGKVTLKSLHLGSQNLRIIKSAFASYNQPITVSSGTHTVPGIALRAVGNQYSLMLSDYVSGKAITSAETTSGQASAETDTSGKSILTVQPSDAPVIIIEVSSKGYRTEKLSVKSDTKSVISVKLVPTGKDVFISKKSGKYDLYTADYDGSNLKILLAATGNENQNIALKISPDGAEVALVSTRDNQRNGDGYLLSTLTLVNVTTGAVTTVEHSEAINLLGWSDSKIVYEQIAAGASAANPNRQRINDYDYQSNKKLQLTAANYFDSNLLIGNEVYYAVSSTDPNATANASMISVDGTNKQSISSQEVFTMLRSSFDTLSLQTTTGWLSYVIGSTTAKSSASPADYTSKDYLNSSDGNKSLWVDNRDGKGVLLLHDAAGNKDVTITSQAGIMAPLHWVNTSTVTYRVNDNKETADYIVSTLGGEPKKITDVTQAQ